MREGEAVRVAGHLDVGEEEGDAVCMAREHLLGRIAVVCRVAAEADVLEDITKRP